MGHNPRTHGFLGCKPPPSSSGGLLQCRASGEGSCLSLSCHKKSQSMKKPGRKCLVLLTTSHRLSLCLEAASRSVLLSPSARARARWSSLGWLCPGATRLPKASPASPFLQPLSEAGQVAEVTVRHTELSIWGQLQALVPHPGHL